MRKSKWIQGTSPAEPVTIAAHEALRARLRTVAYYLPLASNKSDRDVEYIHQLRVATRRAVALLRIFRDLLSDRDAKWLNRKLKKIRRAAGEARDLDVLGRRIAEWVEQRPTAARTSLLHRVEEYRDAAQQPVRKLHKKLQHRKFAARVEKIVRRIAWRGEGPQPSFAAAAAGCLKTVSEPFFTAAAGDSADLAALHQFRIAAKHLRYSMEVFAGAFDAEFRTVLYPCVEEVQTRLGAIHDHAAAIERFQAWLSAWEDGPETEALREMADLDRAALAATRQNFIRWWTPERAAELRQKFERELAAQQPAAAGEKSA